VSQITKDTTSSAPLSISLCKKIIVQTSGISTFMNIIKLNTAIVLSFNQYWLIRRVKIMGPHVLLTESVIEDPTYMWSLNKPET